MPNDSGPKTCLAADSDETGQLSAQTLLLRDFWRRVSAFLGIASGARNPLKEFCRRQNSRSKPAMRICDRARRITEKEKETKGKKKEEPVRKELPASGGGGLPDQDRQFYRITNTKQQF
jgi:hypothetical protein